MAEHAAILRAFLTTDLYRLDGVLAEQEWTEELATRLHEHLQRLAALVVLVGGEAAAPPQPDSAEGALESLHGLTDALLDNTNALSEQGLEARVLDPHERNLPLIAHLYDYARLSAMLVEWSRRLPEPPSLDDWFADEAG